jgi:hypothetical protein
MRVNGYTQEEKKGALRYRLSVALIYQNAFERVEIEKLHGRKGTESFQKDYL